MKLLNSINGLWLMLFSTKVFNPKDVFKGKRVAVIGAADSAFENKDGDYINTFDYIVRINKAPHSLTKEKMEFIGNRTDVLFHSFYENEISGGGPIDLKLYNKQGIKYIVNPNNNLMGLKVHLNYFKRNLNDHMTYLLPKNFYKHMIRNFGTWIPTAGYSGLYSVMQSGCSEIYITGFTFFKTPYADDYRVHLQDLNSNNDHIKKQGLHNPDLEFEEFLRQLDEVKAKDTHIILDPMLMKIIENQKN